MRKIRLSDTDVELFDIEIAPSEYTFYQRHKDAFKTMWKEQGKPFWTRYVITFRSFTVKHGVIKQMNIDTPKFENLIDQAFIFIHDQFVDGTEKTAKNFVEDIARLAQNQDKFPALDSKSFARDPFYLPQTRELFRSFFGAPDQKSSYLKVYILCPVFMRFGGSVCRCLDRWLAAPAQDDPNDDSYWVQPQRSLQEKSDHKNCIHEIVMCDKCIDNCGELFFKEKILNDTGKPLFIDSWKLGDPRFNDPSNPLFAPHVDPDTDWRHGLTAEAFREFLYYCKNTYGSSEDECEDCLAMRKHKEKVQKMMATECRKKSKIDEKDVDWTKLEDYKILKEKFKELEMDDFGGINFENCTEDTALRLSETLLDLTKNKLSEETLAAFGMEEREELQKLQKLRKQEKKRQRKKASRARARAEEASNPEKKKENSSDGDEGETVGAFKIERDNKKGVVSVTVTTSEDERNKKNGLQNGGSKVKGLPEGVSLTIDLIRDQISGLPKFFEFWEGSGYLIAVLNYDEEEKNECEKPTNFTVKVSGVQNKLLENVIVKLLFYVQKRKKRKSLGWNMESDDVIQCIFDEEVELAGLQVNIFGGNFFKAKLTKKERASLKQSLPHKKTLMMLDPKTAQDIRESENGKEKFMNIMSQVCCNGSKREKMAHCNRLWDKLLCNPDKFEFALTVNSARVEELSKIGLMPVEMGVEDDEEKDPPMLCRDCFQINCDHSGPGGMLHFDPDMPYHELPMITGDQYRVIGGITRGTGDDKHIELYEIDQDFIRARQQELGGKCTHGDHVPLLGKNNPMLPQSPEKKAPPAAGRNINLSFSQDPNEDTLSVKLEAFMPDKDYESTEAMLNTLKEEFKKGLSPEQAKLLRSIDIETTCEPPHPEETPSVKKQSADSNTPVNKPPVNMARVHKIGAIRLGPASAMPSPGPEGRLIPLNDDPNLFIRPELVMKSTDETSPIKVASHESSPTASKANSNGKSKEQKLVETKQTKQASESASEKRPFLIDDSEFKVRIKKSHEPGPTVSVQLGDRTLTSEDPEVQQFILNSLIKKEQLKKKSKVSTGGKTEKPEVRKSCEESAEDHADDKKRLRKCSHCHNEEPRRKAFKKCQKCKEEGVKEVRYYCGRECQEADWKKQHKMEHKEKRLV